MRISDWSSDVCSSDLQVDGVALPIGRDARREEAGKAFLRISERQEGIAHGRGAEPFMAGQPKSPPAAYGFGAGGIGAHIAAALLFRHCHAYGDARSEEHTSELQPLMLISYAVLCLKTKIIRRTKH